MTCIVGLEHKGKVYIGGDSAGVAGYNITIRADQKVFSNGPTLMGFTSSFRMGQLLQYDLKIPKHKKSQTDMEYLVVSFVTEVRECFKNGGVLEKHNNVESCGIWLLGYNSKLYEISSDFQVGRSTNGYQATGSGQHVALGSLYATKEMKLPVQRILLALEAASFHNAGVAAPFLVLNN